LTDRTVVHLVPHTHWDREWYEPFQTFRMRLVELVDELLERMDGDPRMRFTLDGQAATIDDYLEVRPAAEPLIRRLIAEDRLAIGPWQILMDEFLVSGETIIRNLELGWDRAEGLGRAMPVGYLPDMFGHIAQMPQILRRADDAGVEVRLETLADYAARPEPDDRPAQRWAGELRSGARANMLMGVTSARIDLKSAAARAERVLERYAEPLAALHGGAWPERLLELAWRRMVDNSAHDSICGCSHDAVVAQVLSRFAEAEQIGRGIVTTVARRIASHVPATGWAIVNPSPVERTDLVTLDVAVASGELPAFTADGRALAIQELRRKDPLVARIRLRGDEVAELLRRRRHGRELFGRQLNGYRIDTDGDTPAITLLVDDVADPPELDVDELIDAVTAAAEKAPSESWDVAVIAPDRRVVLVRVPTPALGWTVVESGGSSGTPVMDVEPVVTTERSLRNGPVEVDVGDDGTFRIEAAGSQLAGVGRLVDGGDFGDSYNYGPPANDRLIERPRSVSIERAAAGPLLGALVIHRTYDLPAAVEPTGAARTDATVSTEVVTRLELRVGEPFLRIRVDFENRSRDHRLRWHIPLPGPAAVSAAEGQFAVVERGLTMEGGHGEVPLPTYPAQGFVHAAGVTVLLDQITEYELVEHGRELALTLLRSFGLISRNANPYREDPAGPEIAVPAGQLLGPSNVAFALMPHSAGWSDSGVLAAMERYRHPLVGVRGTSRQPTAPDAAAPAGLSIEGPGVVLSALRRRDDWLELRLVAEHAKATEATIRGAFREARAVDLLGRGGASIPVAASVLRLPLEPWEIATVRLR
jgi:mannosylglycerate hydrolase